MNSKPCMRKFFKMQAQKVMIYENVEKLMGHRVDYSTNSYYKPTEKDLLEDYLKAVPDLTIYKPAATEEQLKARMDSKDQELQQLQEHQNQLKEQINRMASEMRFFRNEFKAYKGQFGPRSLTEEERKKVDGLLKAIEMKNNPDESNDD